MDRTVVQAAPHTLSSALAWKKTLFRDSNRDTGFFHSQGQKKSKVMKKRFGGFAC
jgi:hypothetical protein